MRASPPANHDIIAGTMIYDPIAEELIDHIMSVMEEAFDPAFGEAWTRPQVLGSLILENCHFGVLDDAGHPPVSGTNAAGFYMSRNAFDEEELLLLAVHPRSRRRGIATKLLEELIAGAQARGASRIFLEMRDGNPAELLYRASGFSPIGRRPNYYRGEGGERIDAITFEKILRETDQ
jgi:ribosomal-protein-alanine N-acetyltransferase